MRALVVIAFAAVTAWTGFSQTYTISTFAGSGLPSGVPGTSAALGLPASIAVDYSGNVFVADQYLNAVLRLDGKTNLLTVVAGNGVPGFSGDNGPATSAQLASPQSVAVDFAGNVYIADTSNNRVRMVTNGVITTLAGTGTSGYSGDNGSATSAQLNADGVAVDGAGNVYIVDTENNNVRKVTNGVITTFISFPPPNRPGLFQISPVALAIDSSGNLLIADTGNEVFRVYPNGVRSDEISLAFSPKGIAVDSGGNVYIAGATSGSVIKVSNGVMTQVAGNGISGFSGDNGPAINAELDFPRGLAVDSAGNLYIADSLNFRVRKVSNGVITTAAGGDSINSLLHGPWGIALDSAGHVYIADYLDNQVREVLNGVLVTVAGDGTAGFSGDNGPAVNAQLNGPWGVAVDSANNLYIADTRNVRVRKVSNGVITTVAGNGTSGNSGDNGPATSAAIYAPISVAVDFAGDIYFSEGGFGLPIRMVSNGVISTVFGTEPPPLAATNSVAVDSHGNLYVSYNNGSVKWFSGVAGNGTNGFGGDLGPASSAELNDPWGIAVDSAGNVYIADTSNNRIRKVSQGVITTIAGGGTSFGDGGPATSAQLSNPLGIAVDPVGNVYIADNGNNRIRLVSVAPMSQTITFPAPNNVTFGVPPFAIGATASSGLPVSFVSSTPVVCTIFGNTVTVAGPGTCTITASQSGSANYAAAPPVTQSFTINPLLMSQTIIFGALNDVTFGGSLINLVATASSGLAVSYVSLAPSVCVVSGSVAAIVAGGTCSIQASQAGNASYAAAPPVTRSFTVNPAPQTIAFARLSNVSLSGSPIVLAATAGSGLAVSFISSTHSVCTVSGSTLTLLAVGTCTITADQAGSANYFPAPPVTQSFTVSLPRRRPVRPIKAPPDAPGRDSR